VDRAALFSPCRTWRYSLSRQLSGAGTVAFIGLNPSTADETRDDPTIRRCLGFARDWGFALLEVVNVYGLRATDPRDLRRASDPVGPGNDRALSRALERADLVVAAWGVHARPERIAELRWAFGHVQLHALGLTRSGAPRHPLYLRADAKLVQLELPAVGEAGRPSARPHLPVRF
jgi:hypothetical protein